MKKTLLLSILAIILMSAQLVPVSLRITIRDELGNISEGASVTLYKSMEDYNKKENPVTATELTNKKGIATFKNLEQIPYFIHAEKEDLNNEGKGVQTDTLQKARINKVTIIID